MSHLPGESRFTWDAARLQALLTCPRQFRYSYVDGIPAVPTAPRVFGRAMHKMLAWADTEQMATGVLPSADEMEVVLRVTWQEALETENPFFGPRHPSPDEYQRLGRQMLDAFFRDYEQQTPLMADLAFDVTVNGHRLVGTIDRVDDAVAGVTVVDYTSGQKKPSPAQAESDRRLTIWALVLQHAFGWEVEQVGYRFLRDGRFISSTRNEHDFTTLTHEVLSLACESIERREFAPHPGYWCRFCDYRELCAAETMRHDSLCARRRAEHETFLNQAVPGTWGMTTDTPASSGQRGALKALVGHDYSLQEEVEARFGVCTLAELTSSQAISWLVDEQRRRRIQGLPVALTRPGGHCTQ